MIELGSWWIIVLHGIARDTQAVLKVAILRIYLFSKETVLYVQPVNSRK